MTKFHKDSAWYQIGLTDEDYIEYENRMTLQREMIRKHLEGYLTHYGMLTDSRGGVSGNDPMYTIQWMHIDTQFSWSAKVDFFKDAFAMHECKPGQFFRTPDAAFGHESLDNLLAWISLGPPYSVRIYDYLKENWGFYWTTENPNPRWTKEWFIFPWQCFMTRFVIPYPFMRAMNCNETWLDMFILKRFFRMAPDDDNGMAKRLLMENGLKDWCADEDEFEYNHGKFTDLAAMFHNYFGDENHPIVRALRRNYSNGLVRSVKEWIDTGSC